MQFVGVFTRGAVAAYWAAVWAVGFGAAIASIVVVVGLLMDATGVSERYRMPSEGERVAECRMLPGFPNYDRNMRFSGCEAQ